jgi:glutamate 5-kinase
MTERRPIPIGSRLVLKIGSSSLSKPSGGIDQLSITRVIQQVCTLWDLGYPTVLVSSGAVSAGMSMFGGRPTDITGLQVAAAIGQTRLMEHYSRAFGSEDKTVGQVLITKDILGMRSQYLHARDALTAMLEMGVVPIVNENDTVAVEELKLGDNDRLAAIVSHLVSAHTLILLTDTEGLYSADPRVGEAELLSAVRHTDEILDEVAKGGPGPMGSGGVATKVAAARMAAWSGIGTVVAKADEENVVTRIVAGEAVGTYVAPQTEKLTARKLWIAFGQPSEGSLSIDAGAVDAMANRGSSLLPVGVVAVSGEFNAGAAVEVMGPDGALVANGVTSFGASKLRDMMGKRSSDLGPDSEAIHRDQLVVLVASL